MFVIDFSSAEVEDALLCANGLVSIVRFTSRAGFFSGHLDLVRQNDTHSIYSPLPLGFIPFPANSDLHLIELRTDRKSGGRLLEHSARITSISFPALQRAPYPCRIIESPRSSNQPDCGESDLCALSML